MLSLSLAEFPSLSTEERLALGRQLAHTLGPAWAASGELVGSSQMIELVHQSGVAFVVVGRARFERGLRDAERDALITAMLGPQGEDEAELDLEAERRFMARQIPPNAMAPELVEVPAFLISREPLSVARAASLGTSPLQDLGYPEALADASEWGAFTMDLPDGLRMPTEDEWELRRTAFRACGHPQRSSPSRTRWASVPWPSARSSRMAIGVASATVAATGAARAATPSSMRPRAGPKASEHHGLHAACERSQCATVGPPHPSAGGPGARSC